MRGQYLPPSKEYSGENPSCPPWLTGIADLLHSKKGEIGGAYLLELLYLLLTRVTPVLMPCTSRTSEMILRTIFATANIFFFTTFDTYSLCHFNQFIINLLIYIFYGLDSISDRGHQNNTPPDLIGSLKCVSSIRLN